MSKKMKKQTNRAMPVGDGEYKIHIGDDGSILSADRSVCYATAAEVRSIAEHSERLHSEQPLDPVRRTASGYDIAYRNSSYGEKRSGEVQVGCQAIPYAMVQKIAALSAAKGRRAAPAARKRRK